MKTNFLTFMFLMATFFSFAQTNRKMVAKNQNYAKEVKAGPENINLFLKGNEPLCELTSSLKSQLSRQGLKLSEKQYEQLGVHVWTTVNPGVDGFTIVGKIIRFKWSKVDILLSDGTKITKREIQFCISLNSKCE